VLFLDTTGHDYIDGLVFYSIPELKRFWLKCYQGPFRLIYRPLDAEAEFPELCRLVIACKNLTLVVEELDIYCRQGRTCPEFFEIIRRGRHHNIELIGVSQRPHGFGRDLTSQAKEFYIFNTREPKDVAYLKDYFGEYLVSKVEQLQEFEYVKALEPFNESDVVIMKDDIYDTIRSDRKVTGVERECPEPECSGQCSNADRSSSHDVCRGTETETRSTDDT